MNNKILLVLLGFTIFYSCKKGDNKKMETLTEDKTKQLALLAKGTFGYDVEFVKKHQSVVVLTDRLGKAQVLLCPEYQGRVLTSTANGITGKSFGWLNYERIASQEITPHIQSYGGEDRFWIGPQGGQYTVFFNPGDPFDFDHWFTPAPFDTEPFALTSQTATSVSFYKKMQLTNYSKTKFDVEVKRKVRLIDSNEIKAVFGLQNLDSLETVAFESENEMINVGNIQWKEETGLLSIWILGMFPSTNATTTVVPFKEGKEKKVGKQVNEYFTDIVGKLSSDNLKIEHGKIYYKTNGNYIGKIGVDPIRAKEFFGSYDAQNKVLTLIEYSLTNGATDYVNSSWEIQKEPYSGDVINIYNDGKLNRMSARESTFYELESSSPARSLRPGESITHRHKTYHFQGDEKKLDVICKTAVGVGIEKIRSKFNGI